MQKLKCIGGACNGYIVELDNYYHEHDQVQVYAKIEFRLADFEEEVKAWREKRVPDNMANPIYYYKVSIINFSKYSYIKFLIPMKWDAEDAVRFALGV